MGADEAGGGGGGGGTHGAHCGRTVSGGGGGGGGGGTHGAHYGRTVSGGRGGGGAPGAEEPPPEAAADAVVAGAKRKVNVHLVEVKVHDFPFMFHVAVEDVAPGEELLTVYGGALHVESN